MTPLRRLEDYLFPSSPHRPRATPLYLHTDYLSHTCDHTAFLCSETLNTLRAVLIILLPNATRLLPAVYVVLDSMNIRSRADKAVCLHLLFMWPYFCFMSEKIISPSRTFGNKTYTPRNYDWTTLCSHWHPHWSQGSPTIPKSPLQRLYLTWCKL